MHFFHLQRSSDEFSCFLKTRLRVASFRTRIDYRIFVFNSWIVCEGSRYTISFMFRRDSSHWESNLGSAQAMKSDHFFPFIVQEDFCPKILLFHWNSAGAHHPVRRSRLLDSFEAWEAKNIEAFFCTYFLSHFRLRKSEAQLSPFRQGAPYHSSWGFWSVLDN